jgi:microcystin-dependent protein
MSGIDTVIVSKEMKDAIRKEAVSQVSKWFLGGLVVLVGFALLGWWNILKPWLISELNGNPERAVIMVDARETCPHPWKDFSQTAGRFILGAGRSGNDLEPQVGHKGGTDSVRLSADQLPPHEHPIEAVLTAEAYGSRRGWTDNDGGWWPGRVWIRPSDPIDNPGEPDRSLKGTRKAEVQTGATSQPIPIMPPYFVLRYCIRS